MKVRTLITTASVTLALVVPVAASAQILEGSVHHRMVPTTSPVSGHASGKSDAAKIKALIAKNKALAAKNKTLKARLAGANTSITTTVTQPNPAASTPTQQSSSDREEYCYGHMVDCTDEELCSIWGANCNLVALMVTTPADESSAVAPATETAVADSPADSSQSTDSVPVLPPVELSPNLDDDQYYGGF